MNFAKSLSMPPKNKLRKESRALIKTLCDIKFYKGKKYR